MYIILIIVLCLLSNHYLDFIHLNLKKFKKVKNIFLLIASVIPNVSNNYIPKKSKRKLTDSTKKYIASQQKWICNSCKKTLDYTYEIDHINPLYKGGSNNIDNLQALCRNCHGKKTFSDTINF